MRHLLSYLLLTLAAFQGGAFLMLPLAQVGAARSQASLRLWTKAEGEERFVLSAADFLRNRSGAREWWHNGQLYDLKTVAPQGDSVQIIALPDAREQWLLSGFQRLFGLDTGTAPGSNPLTHLLIQLLAQPFLATIQPRLRLRPGPGISRPVFFFQAKCLLGFALIFSPPPKY